MADELRTVHLSDGCAIKAKIIGNDSRKPLLIAHHGAPGLSTHKEPELQFRALEDLFRILVFDMRGSGDSDKKRPYTHKQWVQDIDELRQWAKAETFVMIGASHGGFLTLEYILAYPQHVAGAIVGDSGAQWAHWAAMSSIKTALTDPRVKVDPEQVLRCLSGNSRDQEDLLSFFPTVGPLYSVPDHLKAEAETNLDELMGNLMPFYETQNAAHNDCLSRYDVRDRLHEIKIPIFVYCGRYDWITPVQINEELARGISISTFVIYEKSGHVSALEEKTAWGRDVRQFLKKVQIEGLKV